MRIGILVVLGLTMLAGAASADHAVPWAHSQVAWAEEVAWRYGADPRPDVEWALQQATDAADHVKADASASADALAAQAQGGADEAAAHGMALFWAHEAEAEAAVRALWAQSGEHLCCIGAELLAAFATFQEAIWAEKAELEYPFTYALEGAPAQLDAAAHGGMPDPFYACGPFAAYAAEHLPAMPAMPALPEPVPGITATLQLDLAWSC